MRLGKRAWTIALVLVCGQGVACSDGGSSEGDGGGALGDGRSVGGDGGRRDSSVVGPGDSGAGTDGSSSTADASRPDAPKTCVPESFTLAFVGPNGGSQCSFDFNKSYTPGQINLLLTPGWGTVCHAGSSQGCGSGASADGWWFSGGQIHLCDATCSRFYKQTIAGKLTVRLGCPTESCSH